jgi:hypothetical protein
MGERMRSRWLIPILAVLISPTATIGQAEQGWKSATFIQISHVNEWCRHCPDWNQSFYSFKLDDGTVYVGRTHATLDITLNGHTSLRFEKNGHVGDHFYVRDDAGKERKLTVTQKIAPKQ